MRLLGSRSRTSIDLFAGCGGLSLGLHSSGFHHLGLVEWNRHACDTLRLNAERGVVAPPWPVFDADVRSFDYGPFGEDVDLLTGGAPCQPFSLGGKHRADKDGRNMFPEVFRAIRALHPKVVLLENVRGLKRESFSPYFSYILAQLADPHVAPLTDEDWRDHRDRLTKHRAGPRLVDLAATYTVHERTLHAPNFGVPQSRYRVIMVAVRDDLGLGWSYPDPTHSLDRLLFDQYVTGSYWEQHRLPRQAVPAKLEKRVATLASRLLPPDGERWATLRDAIRGLPEPIDGAPSDGLDFHVGIPGARVYPGHTGNHLDAPAKTIKAGDHGNPGGEHILIRDDGSIRYFTVREAARVQAFPDAYHFAGSRTEAMRQIGNAVPVGLAEVLGRRIRKMFEAAALAAYDEREALSLD